MRITRITLALLSTVILTSCEGALSNFGGAPAKEHTYYTFLPGECLASTELIAHVGGNDSYKCKPDYSFSFQLKEKKEVKTSRTNNYEYYIVPSDEAYQSFGKNKKKVKEEYERLADEMLNHMHDDYVWSPHNIMTIIYDGGISLTANRSVLGQAKGENLIHLFSTYAPVDDHRFKVLDDDLVFPNQSWLVNEVYGLPIDYFTMMECGISIHSKYGYKPATQNVTLELKIPVKVVMFLTWLNDRMSNPDAPIPVKNDTLHCRFVTSLPLE